MNKKKKGFTLIELIVVIAIIAILAAVAIPQFGGFRDKATKSANTQAASAIANAANLHLASIGDTAAKALVDADLETAALAAITNPPTADVVSLTRSADKLTVTKVDVGSGTTAGTWPSN